MYPKWSLLLIFVPCLSTCWKMTLVHTNDMHAWLDEGNKAGGYCIPPDPCFGGFPRVKYFADWAKKNYKNVIFLNAGDMFQGTNYYTLYKWKIIELFVDKLGIDVMSLGNHEFDDGMSGVVPYLKSVKTPWICANLNKSGEHSFCDVDVKPWHFLNVDGKKIAIIGYLTPNTKILGDMGNLTLTNEIESLKAAAKEVKLLGADIVIALGHSGWDMDLKIGHDVPDIDLVVGGHSHTFHYTGTPPSTEVPLSTYPHMIIQPSAKVVPMVQAYAWTKYVGVLHLKFDSQNRLMTAIGNPVIMNSSIPEDKELRGILDIWKKNVTDLLSEKIGKTLVDLNANNCRLEESNLGNLITDALVDHRRQMYNKTGRKGWTDAPVAIVNSGDIRASITRKEFNGSITVGSLLSVMPFTEKLIISQVNGSIFRLILEHSVESYDPTGRNQSGAFLQYSGVKVEYDVSKPPGNRVVSALVRCGPCSEPKYSPLTPNMNISLITSSFITSGGDGFSWLVTAPKETIVNATFFNTVKQYIEEQSPIKIGLEKRITITGINETTKAI